MTLNGIIFYVLAVLIVVSTGFAVTRRLVVHAVVYVMISFLATGLLFYLLGAPFLAALEVIIYAGGIMVLFLFVVMTVKAESKEEKEKALTDWVPAVVLSVLSFLAGGFLIFEMSGSREALKTGMTPPVTFGQYLFRTYWFPVEIASFLLLMGLVGALYLGRQEPKEERKRSEERP